MLGNFIKEATATTGTGTLTLTPMSGFERYSTVFAVGALAWYCIQDGANREIGIGTVGASNTLARTTILETWWSGIRVLNPGSGVSLSGNAVVYCDIPMQYTPNVRRATDIAAANPTLIWNIVDGDVVDITGAAGIFGFGNAQRIGQMKIVRFTGVCTLVHGASLVCPGGVSITTAAGDYAIIIANTIANAHIALYGRANGNSVVAGLLLSGGTMTGAIAMGNNNVTGIRNATFSIEFDNGNSGSSKTIDWTNGQNQVVTLDSAAVTLTISNPPGPGHYQLKLVQDGTGGRVVTWSGASYSASRWLGSSAAPSLNAVAGGISIANFYYDGSSLFQALSKVGAA